MRTRFVQATAFALAIIASAPAQDVDAERIQALKEDAKAAYSAGEWKDAARLYRKIVKLDSDNGLAWHRLGYVLHAGGRLDEALEVHRKASRFDDYKMISLYNIACVHALQKDKDAAFAALQRAFRAGYRGADHMAKDTDMDNLRKDPRYAKIIAAMQGDGYSNKKKKDKHAKSWAKSDKKKSSNAWTKNGKKKSASAWGKSDQKKSAGAWAKGDKKKAEWGEHVEKLADHGADAFQEANWAKAASAYGKLVKLKPDHGEAWFRLGYAAHALGKLDAALNAHQKAAKFDAYRALGSYNAGCVHAMRNDKDKAFQWLRKAVEAGFKRRSHIEQDSDLDNLREDPRYRKLLAMVEGGAERGHSGDAGYEREAVEGIKARKKAIEKLEKEIRKLEKRLEKESGKRKLRKGKKSKSSVDKAKRIIV